MAWGLLGNVELISSGEVPAPALDFPKPANTEKFGYALCNMMGEVCDKHGGPQQYLMNTHKSTEDKQQFAKTLFDELGNSAGDILWSSNDLKIVSGQTYKKTGGALHRMHLAQCAFDFDASPRELTTKDVAIKLTERIVTEGFLTRDDNILLSINDDVLAASATGLEPWADKVQNPLPIFALRFTKGRSRVVTVLCILSMCFEDGMTGAAIKKAGLVLIKRTRRMCRLQDITWGDVERRANKTCLV